MVSLYIYRWIKSASNAQTQANELWIIILKCLFKNNEGISPQCINYYFFKKWKKYFYDIGNIYLYILKKIFDNNLVVDKLQAKKKFKNLF